MTREVREIVEANYELGRIIEIFEIFGGYTSRAFRIVLEMDGSRKDWFFRKYMKPKPEDEVLFEHNLLLHARKNGFTKSTVPIPTNGGITYVSKTQGEGKYLRQYYFTLYDFMYGVEPYDWIVNEMPRESYIGIAEIIAEFHCAVHDFDPKGLNGAEPPSLDFVKILPDKFRFYADEYSKAGLKNCFTDYLDAYLGYLEEISTGLGLTDEIVSMFPVIPIQCDVHPGNYMFNGDKCTGVFDFEASKMDIRIFEVALAVFNCFSSWAPKTDGDMRLDEAYEFLSAYNTKLLQLKSPLPPLNETEKNYFCEALQLSNLYMTQWCTRVYHTDMTNNEYEYFYYLQHMIRSTKWVEGNRADILDMMNRL